MSALDRFPNKIVYVLAIASDEFLCPTLMGWPPRSASSRCTWSGISCWGVDAMIALALAVGPLALIDRPSRTACDKSST
jgi:hypothetical protein